MKFIKYVFLVKKLFLKKNYFQELFSTLVKFSSI